MSESTCMSEFQIHAEQDTLQFEEPDLPVRFTSGMKCPIEGCTAAESTFVIRSKFVRHWEEKHEAFSSKYECAVKGCQSLVRRKEDMRLHIASKHGEKDSHLINSVLSKCSVVKVQNKGFIDPGFFKLHDEDKTEGMKPKSNSQKKDVSQPEARTPAPVIRSVVQKPAATGGKEDTSTARKRVATDLKSLVHSVSNDDDVQFNVHLPADSKVPRLLNINPPKSKPAKETSASTSSSKPVTETSAIPSTPLLTATAMTTSTATYPSLPVLPKFLPKTDFATQTSIVDINNLYVPPIPDNSTEELEEYIRHLCNTMDVIGRLRESAKEKLLERRKSQPRKESERKLEAENRALKKQIAEMKWRDEVFNRNVEP